MRQLLSFFLLSVLVMGASAKNEASLYASLDSMLACQQQLTDEYVRQIGVIKGMLDDSSLSLAEQYALNERLYYKYEAFIYDSAFKYVDRTVALAYRLNDPHRLVRSLLNKAHVISVVGLFEEAENILKSIRPERLAPEERVDYYYTWNELYIFKAEYGRGSQYAQGYIDRAMAYRKLVVDLAPHDSYLYVSALSSYICERRQYDRAIGLLSSYLNRLRPGSRRYSILTSTLAFFYETKNDRQNRRRYLIMSAISDLKGCIRENNSLRELSSMLFADGEMDRAYRYLNVSIQDANFYGTRLRNIQASVLIPQIVAGYENQQAKQHRHTVVLIIVLSIATVLLVGVLWIVFLLMKRYRRANFKIDLMNKSLNDLVEQLSEANALMSEGNKLKEEYIGRFLELSSTLIDHAEEERKLLNRHAREHNLPELYARLKNNMFIADSTRLFYINFDSAFLNIYPNFVSEVNKLLAPDGQIMPRKGEKLTTELRILALIRLGITDNQRISAVLRSGITTIYTYRSKLRARSLVRDDFEQRVAEIDSYRK